MLLHWTWRERWAHDEGGRGRQVSDTQRSVEHVEHRTEERHALGARNVWNAKVPRKGRSNTRDFQFRSGPRAPTPRPRTAPHPSVNTSTEYSLARPTQFRNKHAVGSIRLELLVELSELSIAAPSKRVGWPVIPYSHPFPQGKPCTAPSFPICPAATTTLGGATTANRSRDGSSLQE